MPRVNDLEKLPYLLGKERILGFYNGKFINVSLDQITEYVAAKLKQGATDTPADDE